jgi:hypothetical protein
MLSPLYGQLSPLRVPTILAPDPDALAYIAAVETADGATLEDGVKSAINNFVAGCKSDGIWDAIKGCCILAGARTLHGALVPLVGAAPTNNNFVGGDYDRETGLVGNGTTKYLDSNRANNADPQDDQHIAVYMSTPNTENRWYAGAGVLVVGATTIFSNSDTLCGARNRSTSADSNTQSNNAGLLGMSRDNASDFIFRNGNNATISRASQTPFNGNIGIFVSLPSTAAISNARLSFYSIGESLDLALLDTRVSTLMTALAAAI